MPDIGDCLRQVMANQGALGASLIDYPSGSTIGAIGRCPDGSDDHGATATVQLIAATIDTAALTTIGRPDRVEDIVVTADKSYHLVHLAGGRFALYVWLDRRLGNLAMTQRSLRSFDAALAGARRSDVGGGVAGQSGTAGARRSDVGGGVAGQSGTAGARRSDFGGGVAGQSGTAGAEI